MANGLPTDFTTHFGSTAHGLFVNWATVAPTDGSGSTDITIGFEMYLKLKLYVWGRDSDDTNNAADPDDAQWYGGEDNEKDQFINYNGASENGSEVADPKKTF